MAVQELGPASLAVVRAVKPHLDPHRAWPLRLGVSGGADSLALAAGVAHWVRRGEAGMGDVEAMVVDHGLQEGSAQVAAQVAARLDALGLAVQVVRVDADPAPGRGGPEAAARDARLAALRGVPLATTGADPARIMLGHTRDDQAETVLLGLARGSGIRSLSGMPPVTDDPVPLLRPLLGLRRAHTRQACAEWGLDVWNDPHNTDPRFLRSAVRAGVMPALVDVLGGGVVDALARTGDLARDDADLLDALAVEALRRALVVVPGARSDDPGTGTALAIAALRAEPAALRGRVVRSWLLSLGCPEVSHAQVQSVLALTDPATWTGQGPVHLPAGVRVARRAGRLVRA